MRPRVVLIYGATIVAVATLVWAGREVAVRFARKERLLELVLPLLAIATALVCIGVLDWARNLGRRSERYAADYEHYETALAQVQEQGLAAGAESELLAAVHNLERLANEELGAEKTLHEAIKVVAGLADASAVALWAMEEGAAPKLRAGYADGETRSGEGPAGEPVDAQALREAFEHRRPFEAMAEDRVSFLLPLVSNRQCFGVLEVVAPATGPEEERANAAQKLSSDLARLARHFVRAVRAPDLYDQAVTDDLTGLYTKRHFINRLTEATGASRRYGDPLSLVLIDIDNFKMINKTYGHATADRVLQSIAALIQENIREADSAYRHGPDEIAIILPGTEADRAATLAERLRRTLRAHRTVADDGSNIISTVSIGSAEFDEDMRGIGPLIARAEEALYAAKSSGRDRVEPWRAGAAAESEQEAD